MSQLEKTIPDVKLLKFADWNAIASACDNSATWAFFKWLENSSELTTVSRHEIKQIAETIGYGSGWVADKLDEYC